MVPVTGFIGGRKFVLGLLARGRRGWRRYDEESISDITIPKITTTQFDAMILFGILKRRLLICIFFPQKMCNFPQK